MLVFGGVSHAIPLIQLPDPHLQGLASTGGKSLKVGIRGTFGWDDGMILL